ncbi:MULTISPECIES: ATP-binding cassette domain-containing protein [Microbacterium]|uniref:ATP-binding cassette domain-containing protein n=1 Tax=Microbacterium TaxID=33882 RepID=UPI002787263C|nr:MULTISPECIES: ATP-binding cassette domain-containing protein [Microbacterium]MDQ1082228.1 ATP-binding cassette subfamily C protein CydD [Microbacterium sp. SORGH_AS_0344]MDQ1169001.1 ATP-binding cassette subfamily C protein CydD [Microbacterium proteolyticum]
MIHLRLLRLWHGHRGSLAGLVAVGVTISLAWAAQALLLSHLFAALLRGTSLVDADVAPALAALAAVLLVRPALALVRAAVAHRAMDAVKRDLRSRAFAALIERSATRPGDGRSGGDQATVVDGVENLDAYLSSYVPQLAVTGIVFAGVGTALVLVDPLIGTVAVLAAALLPLAPRLWDRVLAKRGGDHWEAYQDLHAEFVDSMHGMTTLVAFGQEQRRERELAAASDTLLRRTLRQLSVSLVESGLSQFALLAVPALVLVLVAARGEQLGGFAVFAALLLSIELVRPLRELSAAWHAGYLGTFSGPPVLDLVAADRGRCDVLPVDRADVALPLVVEGLRARHPGAKTDAVTEATFRIDAGLTAVVGPTGAGKSSIAAVLAGVLPAEAGDISFGGRRADTAEDLRARVALVAQDPALFTGDVRSEIALGAAGRAVDLAAVAARSGIGTGETALALDTALGDGGSVLSGGQRQRVAIARGDAQQRRVLVLDEATSALDPASEARLIGALRAAHPDDAIVAVTHRLAVAEAADRVIVVVGGRVVEADDPRVLRARDGAYARLLAAEGREPAREGDGSADDTTLEAPDSDAPAHASQGAPV